MNVDNDVCIAEYPTENEIIENVLSANNTVVMENSTDEEDEESSLEVIKPPSQEQMQVAFRHIRQYFMLKRDTSEHVFKSINEIEEVYDKCRLSASSSTTKN